MNTELKQTVTLIADIGGTNIRLALAHKENTLQLTEVETYKCSEFTSLKEVIALYIDLKKLNDSVINACLAIACPVDNDLISMTNLPWQFSQKLLKTELNLHSLTFINDYTAIAMAIPYLDDTQKIKVGGGGVISNHPIAVCGPGTGLGVAHLVPVNNKWHCFSGEGGHTDFSAVDELDIKILQHLQKSKTRVSYEQLLSGYGLEQIYTAICSINNQTDRKLTAEDISSKALREDCLLCQKALSQFCKILGSFAGNLALTMNTKSGVYIAGGIVPRFVEYLKNSDFRSRFESKGRLSNITKNTPTFIITEQQPGLLGAAAFLLQ
ncbi:glucokinase [Colwellia sp. E2M01]|uniref:glucokinase n=1 Tax=Colwellia sp. E2M01 TaxID=2841561 RepID=UPI001C088E01|nr:glucokinase [Colwellia sp. E2M01]MBU2870406.1 glucokinase [Colwellia sp. E2M01]